MRSNEAKTERKSYGRFRTQKARRNETQSVGKELKKVEGKPQIVEDKPQTTEVVQCNRVEEVIILDDDNTKAKEVSLQPLAPIIEEIRNREPLKLKGLEIDKIAEKLKSLVKLDKELLVCKESFDEENIEPTIVAVKNEGKVLYRYIGIYYIGILYISENTPHKNIR